MKRSDASHAPAVPSDRLKSIDALRGFDMFWIVGGASVIRALDHVGDNAVTGALARQFTHVQWAGLRAYDVIYPLFLFLIGVSLVFSLDRLRGKESTGRVIRRILGRGALLYVLGVFYHGGLTSAWPAVRLSGVLPFIAVSYVGAALVYWFVGGRWRNLAVVLALLFAGNWAIQTFASFPDVRLEEKTVKALEEQAGSASPAAVLALVPERVSGVYEEGRSFGTYLDYRYLPGKLVNVYFESQGLLSPLGGVAICLLGALGGLLLKNKTIAPGRKSGWLLAAGVIAIGLGCAWSLQFPIVKKLWTSSFCLVTAGISAILLGLFHQIVDVWKKDAWCTPFVWIGMNSITIYLVAEIVRFERLAGRIVGPDLKGFLDGRLATGAGGLLQALAGLALTLVFVRFLYQRKIFLRV